MTPQQDFIPRVPNRSTQSPGSCWTVLEEASVTSTNLVAAKLPAWHAVRGDCQTAGRGRFQRTWVSDAGGLWLSAVLPIPGKTQGAHILPLVAGLAVCESLRQLGVAGLRMRWPNDLLVGQQKLAGLLLDQFVPGLAVVGVGINVSNHPDACDSALPGHVARLADLLPLAPGVTDVMWTVLDALASTWADLADGGAMALLPRINALWRIPTFVEVDLDGRRITGAFHGVDPMGRLRLMLPSGKMRCLEPHEVRLLREIF